MATEQRMVRDRPRTTARIGCVASLVARALCLFVATQGHFPVRRVTQCRRRAPRDVLAIRSRSPTGHEIERAGSGYIGGVQRCGASTRSTGLDLLTWHPNWVLGSPMVRATSSTS